MGKFFKKMAEAIQGKVGPANEAPVTLQRHRLANGERLLSGCSYSEALVF